MAQYNADIRIGVTGKTQLNQLEAQLTRTQKQLNKLNKSLKLRAKTQKIKLDTRAANTQIRNLEQRINKLGRTITLNVRTNEQKRGQKKNEGNNTTILSGGSAKQQNVGLSALLATSVKLKDTDRERLKIAKQLTPVLEQQNSKQKEIASQVAKIKGNRAEAKNVSNGFGTKAQLNRLNFGYDALIRKLKRLRGEYKGITSEVRGYQNAASSVNDDAIIRAEKRRQKLATLRNRKKNAGATLKGAGAGLAASGLSIPGLEGASGGAIAGFAVGGKRGAAAGGLVGLSVDLVKGFAAATSEVTKFNNQLKLSQKALANTVFSSEELSSALASIDSISDDFLVPIGDATKQFTKLNAAARASGFSVEEVGDVYRGLAAANVALGGDAERLNGILLATQQVFSKGKVQAEELRGQIGERLAGAFAKFAESAGMSTSELDKALEKGEVSLSQFVAFSKSLLDEYEEDAKRLATEPENAAARLKLAMDDLKKAAGPILQSIGNAFTELANAAVKSLTTILNAINKFRLAAATGKYQETRRNLQEQQGQLAKDEANRDKDTFIPTIGSNQIISAQTKAVQAAKAANDRAFGDLNRLKGQILSLDLEPSGNPLKPKPGLDLDKPDPKGSGSKSGPTDRTAELRVELDLQTKLNALQDQTIIGTARQVENNQRELEVKRLLLEADAEKQRILLGNTTAQTKKMEAMLVEKQLVSDLNDLTLERAQTEFDRSEELQNTLRGLQEQIDIENALTDEAKLRVEWAARIAELNADGTKTLEEKAILEGKINQLYGQRVTLLNPIVQYQRELEKSLKDTDAMIVSLAQTVESELASAMSSAITGLVDGTVTAQEAFSDMFANIGKAFIDMATQMIAKALIMKALGILTGGSGMQTGAGGMPTSGMGGMFNLSGGQFGAFADGGFVDSPTQATVGEGGNSEYVIPQNKMSSSMDRWNSGMRGDGVISGAEPTEAGSAGVGADQPSVINIEGGVLQFNDSNYIRQDQVPGIIKQAALSGEAKALRKLQMSSATRKRVGM